ncbi:hypothetical protein HWC21_gp028 [Vibrio phage VAP7]|uniref:Uncharacterized protein n=1 Tax=Vibrio phage VAP7 TaxID=2584487 RepID=A0A4Y5TV23_9CAUD|nr:hypothetical protein HWC21_gp028 [Vibrio phage VAP7]QDB73210.1 hypothetical protein [Vibrio phage VAP7]UFD98105.1 hypothetical protein [Vibrio phage BX-1]
MDQTSHAKALASFVNVAKQELDEFMHHCLEEQKKEPENWPIDSWNISEMWEQFEAWHDWKHGVESC